MQSDPWMQTTGETGQSFNADDLSARQARDTVARVEQRLPGVFGEYVAAVKAEAEAKATQKRLHASVLNHFPGDAGTIEREAFIAAGLKVLSQGELKARKDLEAKSKS